FHLMESNHFGWARFLAPKAMGEDNPPHLVDQFESALCALEPREMLPRVRVPCTLVQSLHDSIAPPGIGRWMQARMPGST
ncbi:hypothetical protein ABTK37_20870, partial [Acinetobacter baumannii]